jgi:hypothetical protein
LRVLNSASANHRKKTARIKDPEKLSYRFS